MRTVLSLLAISGLAASHGQFMDRLMGRHGFEHREGRERFHRMGGFIRVSGNGAVTISQDTAYVNYAVTDTQKQATDALNNVAKASSSLMDHLKTQSGLNSSQISSTGFSVQPAYDYSQGSSSQPVLVGYTVSSAYMASVCPVEKVSSLVDDVIRVGGPLVSVSSVSFGNGNTNDAMNQARRLAVEDAISKAKLLLGETGGRVGRLVHLDAVDVSTATPNFYDGKSSARAGAPVVPIAGGENTITASITATFRIEHEEEGRQQEKLDQKELLQKELRYYTARTRSTIAWVSSSNPLITR
jgi:hypothetical protein